MTKQEGFMIRIDSEKHTKLKHISDATSTKMVDISRHAIDALIDYSEQIGIDSVAFPLRYPKLIQKQGDKIKELEERNAELEKLITQVAITTGSNTTRTNERPVDGIMRRRKETNSQQSKQENQKMD